MLSLSLAAEQIGSPEMGLYVVLMPRTHTHTHLPRMGGIAAALHWRRRKDGRPDSALLFALPALQ